MRKALLIGIITLLLCCSAYGAENHDGIWQIVGENAFVSIHTNAETLIGVIYIPGTGEGYLFGNISGNVGEITYSSQLMYFNVDLIFYSDSSGMFAVNSCIPFSGERCGFPTGTTGLIQKVFP